MGAKRLKSIITILLILVIIVLGLYLYQNKDKLSRTIEPTPEVPTAISNGELKVIESPVITPMEKTWLGQGFSFNYPEKLQANDQGLWTSDGYRLFLDPPIGCSGCDLPYIEVKAVISDSVEMVILSDFDLPGSSLAEMSEQTGIAYETINIGDNQFTKIRVAEIMEMTGYYTINDGQVVVFRVYDDNYDNSELREIISTLKFD